MSAQSDLRAGRVQGTDLPSNPEIEQEILRQLRDGEYLVPLDPWEQDGFGEFEAERQVGYIGGGVGFVWGALAVGMTYLVTVNMRGSDSGHFAGFVAATVGGGIVGAYAGATGAYVVMLGGLAVAGSIEVGRTWVNNRYKKRIPDGSNNR